jgi:hypothetical protein
MTLRLIVILLLLLPSLACQKEKRPSTAYWKRIEFAIHENYDKGQDLKEVEKDFELFQELKIQTWRGAFGWDDYEPQQGRFDFEWLHHFCDLAQRHGIRLRPYLGDTPEWAAAGRTADGVTWNDPPARIWEWRNFVGSLARALSYHRNILSYEIYNKENKKELWDGSLQEYRTVFAIAAEQIRSISPGRQVVLGGLVWPDPDWVEGVCELAKAVSLDAVPFHAYPETSTPNTVRVENFLPPTFLTDFVARSDSHCGSRPIWLNETGCATYGGKTERDQAAWWARAIPTFAATPRISLIGVYELKDHPAGSAGDAASYHFGLTHVSRQPKMAFHTVHFLVDFFTADSIQVDDDGLEIRGGDTGIHRHLFRRPDGRRLLVLWSTQGTAKVKVELAEKGKRAIEYAFDGSTRDVPFFKRRTFKEIQLAEREPRLFIIEKR